MSNRTWLLVVALAACQRAAPDQVAAGSSRAADPKAVASDATPGAARAPSVSDAAIVGAAVTSLDGLITVHPQPDFTCEREGSGVVCELQGELDMAVGFLNVADPVSTDLDALAADIEGSAKKAFEQYARTSRRRTTCTAGAPGIETWATITSHGTHLRRRTCVFVVKGHGHAVSYSVPIDDVPVPEQRAQALIDATEFE